MMMYYDNGRYLYNNPLRRSTVEVEAKPIEYASKDEVDYLKEEVIKHTIDINNCLLEIDVNRKDCEQMYQAIDVLKYDAQQVKQIVNYLYDKVESAPIVAKRKRRVTICANGQTVEVGRDD